VPPLPSHPAWLHARTIVGLPGLVGVRGLVLRHSLCCCRGGQELDLEAAGRCQLAPWQGQRQPAGQLISTVRQRLWGRGPAMLSCLHHSWSHQHVMNKLAVRLQCRLLKL
jgi:hypothetical protein